MVFQKIVEIKNENEVLVKSKAGKVYPVVLGNLNSVFTDWPRLREDLADGKEPWLEIVFDDGKPKAMAPPQHYALKVIYVECSHCQSQFDEHTVELTDISEGDFGQDVVDFKCPNCGKWTKSMRYTGGSFLGEVEKEFKGHPGDGPSAKSVFNKSQLDPTILGGNITDYDY